MAKDGSRKGRRDVRFGSLADICSAPAYVRFTLDSGHSRYKRNVGYGPIADSCAVQLTMSAKGSLIALSKKPQALAG